LRSRGIGIGAAGLFYCSVKPQFFTVPFRVESRPENRPIDGAWGEPRLLPFSIRPIGDPSKHITLAQAHKTWGVLRGVETASEVLNLGPADEFARTWFPRLDWDLILEQVDINPEDFEDLFP